MGGSGGSNGSKWEVPFCMGRHRRRALYGGGKSAGYLRREGKGVVMFGVTTVPACIEQVLTEAGL